MTDKRISLEIVTPEKKIYSADVYYLHAPATAGGIGIYPRHTPIVTALDVGELSVDDQWFKGQIDGLMAVVSPPIDPSPPRRDGTSLA